MASSPQISLAHLHTCHRALRIESALQHAREAVSRKHSKKNTVCLKARVSWRADDLRRLERKSTVARCGSEKEEISDNGIISSNIEGAKTLARSKRNVGMEGKSHNKWRISANKAWRDINGKKKKKSKPHAYETCAKRHRRGARKIIEGRE